MIWYHLHAFNFSSACVAVNAAAYTYFKLFVTSRDACFQKLPDTFHGCKIIMPDTTADYKQLKRYIVAFDGDLVPDYDVHTATHIVTSDKSEVCIITRHRAILCAVSGLNT